MTDGGADDGVGWGTSATAVAPLQGAEPSNTILKCLLNTNYLITFDEYTNTNDTEFIGRKEELLMLQSCLDS